MRKIFAILLLLILLFLSLRASIGQHNISQATIEVCDYSAQRTAQGFKDSEFKDFNFFRSCLLNIECSNPEMECPTEEINNISKNWEAN